VSENWDAEWVFRQHAPRVRAYLSAAGAPDADDLLGDVFVSITRAVPKFRGTEDELRSWVFAIARNRLRDEFRQRSRRSLPVRRTPEIAPSSDEPFDDTLMTALWSLTDEQREVVVLRFVADLSVEAVARMTDRSEGAVKSLQHRALATLGRFLDDA
jgi:RNA polymerase sigma-70 factor (ECF subfamily)